MIEASCHCGAVRLRVASAPTDLNECQCSICRRYAVHWAYYAPDDVEISAPGSGTATYIWGERSIVFHRCPGEMVGVELIPEKGGGAGVEQVVDGSTCDVS